MKGKIIDYNYFEAFVLLEDDTVIKVPLSNVNDYLAIGTMVNINSNSLSCSNSSKQKILQDKLVDFF